MNVLMERDAFSMERRRFAMDKISPLLNKLQDEVLIYCDEAPLNSVETETLLRRYIEVDVYDWMGMITLNVLPQENKKLFNALKSVFAEYGVKQYEKENDGEHKRRKLTSRFTLFDYEGFRTDYRHDYKVEVMFRGDLPESCILEYEENYQEVDNDAFVVRKGKIMKKKTSVKVVCDDMSVLRLPQATA